MIKKTLIVTLIFGFSTLIQLLSQIVISRIFGASLKLDIFLAAVSVPTTLITVIYATLNDAFLPLLGEKRTQNKTSSDVYYLTLLMQLLLLSLVVTTILILLSPVISKLLYPSQQPIFLNTVSLQMAFLFTAVPMSIVATMSGTYFYLEKRFFRFPLVQLFGNAANLFIVWLFAREWGTGALICGFIVSVFIQILLIFPEKLLKISLGKLKLGFIKNLSLLLVAWLPLIVGSMAMRSDTVLIRSFGALLDAGYLVYLNIVAKMFALASGVTTIGIQVLVFPHLVEYLNTKRSYDAIKLVNKAKLMALLGSLIVTLGVYTIAPFLIQVLFVGQRFTPSDAGKTISLLPYFILPSLGWGIINVWFQPLLALKKQVTVGIISVLSFSLAVAVGKWATLTYGALSGILSSLNILLLAGIIGSETIWQREKQKLIRLN